MRFAFKKKNGRLLGHHDVWHSGHQFARLANYMDSKPIPLRHIFLPVALCVTIAISSGPAYGGASAVSITITPPSLPAGEVGVPYPGGQKFTAIDSAPGGGGFTFAASGLPQNGISLGNDGTVHGTPTAAIAVSFSVTASDKNGSNTAGPFTINAIAGPSITPTTLPAGGVGTPYSVTLSVTGGSSPYSAIQLHGGLPPGLKFASPPNSGTATISGTPGKTGTFPFSLSATDSVGAHANQNYSLQITNSTLAVGAISLPPGEIGASYSSSPLSVTGGNPPYTWSVAPALPPNLTLNPSTGAITGNVAPAATTIPGLVFTATDATGASASSAPATLTIIPGPSITTAANLPNGTVGAAYGPVSFAANGGTPGYTWSISAGSLPTGLGFNASVASISGTASASGTFKFTVQVSDTKGVTASKQFTINIVGGLTITTSPALPNGVVNQNYLFTLSAAGGTTPYSWAITGGVLAPGLNLTTGGIITGTPSGTGTFRFTATVSDASGHQASQSFSIGITAGLAITIPAQLPNASLNNPYSQTLIANGGTPPYTWGVKSGTLPSGLGLSAGGLLNGTPSAGGSFTFTIQVTDNTGATASQQFSLTIATGLAIISDAILPAGTEGQAYTPLQLAASGGRQPYSWAVDGGTIAPGLSLSSGGNLSGTPATSGSFNFTVQVADANGGTATLAFTLSIIPPALPEVIISGIPDTAVSAQQIAFKVALATPYPLDITGTVTLTFQSDAVNAADDPAIQLSTGGRTDPFKIAANTTTALFSAPQIAFQTGTVSGTITIAVALEAGGTELPSSGLSRTITIARAAPSISAVKIVASPNSFQVQVTAFSPPRDLKEADLTFVPASGANLQTTSATIDLSAVSKQWFEGTASDIFGSQFVLVLPFTASQGSISAVASVGVKLKNQNGASNSADGVFPGP
jgi:hypothetical protein